MKRLKQKLPQYEQRTPSLLPGPMDVRRPSAEYFTSIEKFTYRCVKKLVVCVCVLRMQVKLGGQDLVSNGCPPCDAKVWLHTFTFRGTTARW